MKSAFQLPIEHLSGTRVVVGWFEDVGLSSKLASKMFNEYDFLWAQGC